MASVKRRNVVKSAKSTYPVSQKAPAQKNSSSSSSLRTTTNNALTNAVSYSEAIRSPASSGNSFLVGAIGQRLDGSYIFAQDPSRDLIAYLNEPVATSLNGGVLNRGDALTQQNNNRLRNRNKASKTQNASSNDLNDKLLGVAGNFPALSWLKLFDTLSGNSLSNQYPAGSLASSQIRDSALGLNQNTEYQRQLLNAIQNNNSLRDTIENQPAVSIPNIPTQNNFLDSFKNPLVIGLALVVGLFFAKDLLKK
jgi:hypothetical protein